MNNAERGKYFGYPDCCIKWFVENRDMPFPDVVDLTEKQEAVHGYRGFIPCPKCAESITADTLHTLIKDRGCPMPFPLELNLQNND